MKSHKFHTFYESYRSLVEQRLQRLASRKKPTSIYEPIRYLVSSGGKRLRAVLALLSCEAAGGRRSDAMDAAVAMEALHNFTLVHDDVMDHAELRRGIPTIHSRWDQNVAILAGDQLVALAYESLLKSRTPDLHNVLNVFTQAFIEVCEGQGYDKEFESRRDVSIAEYRMMIRKKTARIIQSSVEIGALIGGGNAREIRALSRFGHHLGMAFQLKDDVLDITGTEKKFGKKIGGDIVEGKKTMLLLLALERAIGPERKLLQSIIPGAGGNRKLIGRVRDIYRREGVLQSVSIEIERHTKRAAKALSDVQPSKATDMLRWMADQLLDRQQ